MALYDIKADFEAPAQGTFQSSAAQSQSLNLNPAFLFGGGTLTSSPSGSTGSDVAPSSQSATPTNIAVPFSSGVGFGGFPAGAGLATLNTALPGSAALQAAPINGTLLFWLLIGGALLLLLPSGGRR